MMKVVVVVRDWYDERWGRKKMMVEKSVEKNLVLSD